MGSERPKRTKLKTQVVVYIVAFCGALSFVVAWKFSEATTGWLQFLFCLPVAAQLVGVAFHIWKPVEDGEKHRVFYRFSMWVSSGCIASYSFLWYSYAPDKKAAALAPYFTHLSWFALVAVAVVMCVVGYMMCAFLRPKKVGEGTRLTNLRDGAAADPLWALSFLFFVIFLDVTFLFGFALAYHDQACLSINPDTPALRMLNIDSPDGAGTSVVPAAVTGSSETSRGVDGKKCTRVELPGQSNGEAGQYFFYFDSLQARLNVGNYSKEPGGGIEKCDVEPTDIWPLKRKNWFNQPIQLSNYCSLKQIVKRIVRETCQGQRTRVTLMGRADDKRINTERYDSNYELALARVENVRYEIADELKQQEKNEGWHNLEWLTLSASNESPPPDEDLETILREHQEFEEPATCRIRDANKRIVIASIAPISGEISALQMKLIERKQFREMNLMDHMYFSVYTITTTGYGDIIPTTAYAKFVISLANICEVLFLVVFFNALVSIRTGKSDEHEQASQSTENSETIQGVRSNSETVDEANLNQT
jgi:hypothetical protein